MSTKLQRPFCIPYITAVRIIENELRASFKNPSDKVVKIKSPYFPQASLSYESSDTVKYHNCFMYFAVWQDQFGISHVYSDYCGENYEVYVNVWEKLVSKEFGRPVKFVRQS